MPAEIITRRNLPHWYIPGAAHFITFRLQGSLPQSVLAQLRAVREASLRRLGDRPTPSEKGRIDKQAFGRFDRELDRGLEPTWLRQPSVAAIVRQSLYFANEKTYRLLAYSIMPNHVHILIQPCEEIASDGDGEEAPDCGSPLSKIMQSSKSFTSHRINEHLGRSGVLWQAESYDHWVRDDDELERIIDYIAANPVKAGLVKQPHEWFFCSAHDRFLQDGSNHTWLDLPR